MLQEVRDREKGEWSWSGEEGRWYAQRLEREARPGSSHLLPLQAGQVHLRFFKAATCEQYLFRKGDDEKRILPLNDIGCISYLTVGWITSTMWKAFRVSSANYDDSQHFSTGRSCSNWLVRHWGARRRSKKRQKIWEDLGRGETEMWKHSPKAFPQQVKFHILQKYLYSRPFHTNQILEIANGVGVGVDS